MERRRTQDGHPTIEVATYKGYVVRVVCGYDVIHDDYVVHLYIAPPTGPEIRVFDPPQRAQHLDEGLDLGFAHARGDVDFMVDGMSDG